MLRYRLRALTQLLWSKAVALEDNIFGSSISEQYHFPSRLLGDALSHPLAAACLGASTDLGISFP